MGSQPSSRGTCRTGGLCRAVWPRSHFCLLCTHRFRKWLLGEPDSRTQGQRNSCWHSVSGETMETEPGAPGPLSGRDSSCLPSCISCVEMRGSDCKAIVKRGPRGARPSLCFFLTRCPEQATAKAQLLLGSVLSPRRSKEPL